VQRKEGNYGRVARKENRTERERGRRVKLEENRKKE